jgi:hypothetical protein
MIGCGFKSNADESVCQKEEPVPLTQVWPYEWRLNCFGHGKAWGWFPVIFIAGMRLYNSCLTGEEKMYTSIHGLLWND